MLQQYFGLGTYFYSKESRKCRSFSKSTIKEYLICLLCQFGDGYSLYPLILNSSKATLIKVSLLVLGIGIHSFIIMKFRNQSGISNPSPTSIHDSWHLRRSFSSILPGCTSSFRLSSSSKNAGSFGLSSHSR